MQYHDHNDFSSLLGMVSVVTPGISKLVSSTQQCIVKTNTFAKLRGLVSMNMIRAQIHNKRLQVRPRTNGFRSGQEETASGQAKNKQL